MHGDILLLRRRQQNAKLVYLEYALNWRDLTPHVSPRHSSAGM